MRINRKIFFWLITFFLICSNSHANIENKIIVKVGNQIITSFELENKIKTMLLLSNQKRNQQNIDQIKTLALKTLVDLKLKKDEINKYKLKEVNNNAIQQHLQKVSDRFGFDQRNLKNFFSINEVDYNQFISEIKSQFLWNKLILEIYSKKIIVNEKQIIAELNEIVREDRATNEYELAEIELDLENSSNKNKLIGEIKNNITEIGFENTATKYSSSSSAVNGGNIGWVNSTILSKEFLEIVKNLKQGEVSKPIIKVNKIIFLKLIKKRSSNNNNLNLDDLKNSITEKKRNELLNLYSNNHLSKKRNNTLVEIK